MIRAWTDGQSLQCDWLGWRLNLSNFWHASHVNYQYYNTMSSLSLFWLVESIRWIFEISARDVIIADYTIIMSRTLKVMSNHVMYDRGTWCSKGNHVKFCAACSQWRSKNMTLFFRVQCIIKQLFDSVFVIFRIIEVKVRVISLSLRLITLTSTSGHSI